MAKWTTERKFSTLSEHLGHSNDLANLYRKVDELNRVTALLHQAFPELALICHCGAIDYANDLVVLFTSNNSAFYTVNNKVSLIQDFLFANGVSLNKLLVKVSPQTTTAKPYTKNIIDAGRHAMLEKFAAAINRPELVKPLADQDDSSPNPDEPWHIKL